MKRKRPGRPKKLASEKTKPLNLRAYNVTFKQLADLSKWLDLKSSAITRLSIEEKHKKEKAKRK